MRFNDDLQIRQYDIAFYTYYLKSNSPVDDTVPGFPSTGQSLHVRRVVDQDADQNMEHVELLFFLRLSLVQDKLRKLECLMQARVILNLRYGPSSTSII